VWGGSNRAATPAPLLNQSSGSQVSAPLDNLSSADIAANIARAVSMPEAIAVSNQADSYNAQISTATVEQSVVTKPQLVAGGAKSRNDIVKYVAVNGDTVTALATKYGVTSDSIKWSNGLTGDVIPAGKELNIPPRNGIVYKVAAGDTVDSITAKYRSNKEQLIAINDIEINGLPVGENILIPDGQLPAPATTTSRYASSDSSTVYGFTAQYGGNGYVPGYCTYYAASRVSIPRNWGNANTWDNYARVSGWTVSNRPVAGAIFQTDVGWAGHVGIVEEVSPDGSQIRVSDMNGFAGYGRVGYSGWMPASSYPNYIYR
jgi:N-acetylmuramoyl-L-alanine amidase